MKHGLRVAHVVLCCLLAAQAEARRDSLTQEQKDRLDKVQRVLVEVLAITDQGQVDAGPLAEVVIRRMKDVGYTVLTNPEDPHDVVLRVKCEQRKIWEGTAASGGDADLPDSPSRVWKGPACQLGYLLEGKKMGWRKEVRTDFADAVQAAGSAGAGDPGVYAMTKLRERLEEYGFPILLAAEWGQEHRLLKLLDEPSSTQARKIRVISMLGEIFATEAVPRLLKALKDPDIAIAKAAALALGNIGQKESAAALTEVLKTGPPELQAAAAKGLGQLGALHGDFSIIQPLLEALKSSEIAVKTEAAWGLGKLPDRRAYEPLDALAKSLTHVRGPDADPNERKLKEAVHWSLKQIDTWEYIQ
jgi:HEAT repeat protein/PBS lyase HEAT-like repeat-containing protein